MIELWTAGHGCKVGDRIRFSHPERRWLVRLWKFITYQDYDVRYEFVEITGVGSSSFVFEEVK